MNAMAERLLIALDSVAFAERQLGFHLDPWQADLLRSPAKRIITLCSRQAGKSTTAAVLALHTALYQPGSLILLVSPSLRQSSELFRKVHGFLNQLPERPRLQEDNKLSLELPSGSRIASLPGSEDTIRGFSAPSLVIEDEAARCEDGLLHAVSPMLAVSDGKLVLMSTPAGQHGHFHRFWTEGDGWERFKVTADECPRISPAFLEQERAIMGDRWFRQEYHCEFLMDADGVFSYDDVMACVIGDRHALLR